MRNTKDRRLFGAGVAIVAFGALRASVALASGNPEHMLLGMFVAFALIALGGIALAMSSI